MEPGERDAMSGLLTTVFGRGPRPSEAVQREIDLVIEPDRMFVVHDGPAVVGIGGSYTLRAWRCPVAPPSRSRPSATSASPPPTGAAGSCAT